MARYWFRQRSFGYGATPNTWQGWALTVIGVLLTCAVVMFGPAIRDNGLRAIWIVVAVPLVLVLFGILAWRKTEGGWRWRSGND
jgi:hypothetical protein